MEKIQDIEVSAIRVSPMNPRRTIDAESLRELADNIGRHGLLQPIIVREAAEKINGDGTTNHYEVVCGERRFRAVKSLGRKVIPAVVRVMDDRQALDAMITENLQRKDVDPMEEAAAFASLAALGSTAEEIALRFGKSERFIAERIRMHALVPELKDRVSAGTMDIGAAQHLCRLGEDEQHAAAESLKNERAITKSVAVSYTRRIFNDLEGVEWNGTFKGSCGTSCAQCQFNTANAGCLFYEMKEKGGRCTAPARYEQKRQDWNMHIIEREAKVLVRNGGDFEKGKTVITYRTETYYDKTSKMVEAMAEELERRGYRVVRKKDFFDGVCCYGEDDGRLREKLDNGEAYRTLDIEPTWRGVELKVRYYYFRDELKRDEGEVEAMKLVGEYKQARERSRSVLSDKLRDVIGDVETASLPDTPLTSEESMALFLCMASKLGYADYEALGIDRFDLVKWCRANKDKANLIARVFLRTLLYKQCWGAEQEAQLIAAGAWSAERTAEAVADNEKRLAKRLEKIERRIGELGYNTDGTKKE